MLNLISNMIKLLFHEGLSSTKQALTAFYISVEAPTMLNIIKAETADHSGQDRDLFDPYASNLEFLSTRYFLR